jgi:hypothetical protein
VGIKEVTGGLSANRNENGAHFHRFPGIPFRLIRHEPIVPVLAGKPGSGRHETVSKMDTHVDHGRHHGNLSSAIRLFVLDHYRGHAVHESAPTLVPSDLR